MSNRAKLNGAEAPHLHKTDTKRTQNGSVVLSRMLERVQRLVYKKGYFKIQGVSYSYEQESATGVVFICGWVDWAGRDCAYRRRFCDGVAAGAGVGAGAACGGGWDGRADDSARTGARVPGDAGVGGADIAAVFGCVGVAEDSGGGRCAEDGGGVPGAGRIDVATCGRMDT